jgi:hypothetical protein
MGISPSESAAMFPYRWSATLNGALSARRHLHPRLALGGDPFVPVVVWISRVLNLDCFEPWIPPGGLVEMAVNTDVAFHQVCLFTKQQTLRLPTSRLNSQHVYDNRMTSDRETMLA